MENRNLEIVTSLVVNWTDTVVMLL